MATIKQNFNQELAFYRPGIRRITNDSLWASVTQAEGESYVSIPVTSEAVYRNPRTGGYLQTPIQTACNGSIMEPFATDQGVLDGYAYGSTMPQLPYGDVLQRFVLRMDSLPFGLTDTRVESSYVNGSRFSIRNYQKDNTKTLAINSLESFVVGSYGMNPQVAVSSAPDFYVDQGSGTYQSSQDVWVVGGFDTSSPYAPLGTVRCINFKESLAANTITATSVFYSSAGSFQRTFGAACVIESDSYKNYLFYAGGFSTFPTTLTSNGILYRRDGLSFTVLGTTSPYPLGMVSTLFNKKHGIVVITGGATTSGDYATTSGCLWNPDTEAWSVMTGALVTARRQHQMVALDDENILIIGGKQGDLSGGTATSSLIRKPLNQCEIVRIDGTANSAAPYSTGSMSDARYSFGKVKLPDGRILVCGGFGGNASKTITPTDNELLHELKTCEIYDPQTGFWTPIAPMNYTHSNCVCIYNKYLNRVYIYGGTTQYVEWMDLDEMVWHLQATLLGSGAIYSTTGVQVCETIGVLPGGSQVPTSLNGLKTWNTFETVRTDGISGQEVTIIGNAPEISNAPGYIKNENYLGDFRAARYILKPADTEYNTESFTAPATTVGLGAYAWDLTRPFKVSTKFTLNQAIERGFKYNELEVVTPKDIPAGSYVVFRYGYSNQTGPVKTFGLAGTKLRIDPGFVFPFSIATGTTVNVVTLGAYEPANLSGLGQFWLTGSNAARTACIDILKQITAANVQLNIDTRYPGDRGLSHEGEALSGTNKISEIVLCYGRDDLDLELDEARNGQ